MLSGDWSSDVCSSDLVAGIGYRNVGTLLSQTNVITVVAEAMRKQTRSSFFAAGDYGKEHWFLL